MLVKSSRTRNVSSSLEQELQRCDEEIAAVEGIPVNDENFWNLLRWWVDWTIEKDYIEKEINETKNN